MRIFNRLLAVLVAVAVLALAVVTTVEVIRAALGSTHWLVPWRSWASDLRRDSWESGPVRTVLFAAAAVGLLLLFSQLKPRRVSTLPLASLTPAVAAATARRSLQQTLQRAAVEVNGVTAARATVRRRKTTVVADAALREPAGLREQVTDQVRQRLDELSLARPPRLTVKVRSKETP